MATDRKNYIIRIAGPGLDSINHMSDEDDFVLIDAMINKMKKHILLNNETSPDVPTEKKL